MSVLSNCPCSTCGCDTLHIGLICNTCKTISGDRAIYAPGAIQPPKERGKMQIKHRAKSPGRPRRYRPDSGGFNAFNVPIAKRSFTTSEPFGRK